MKHILEKFKVSLVAFMMLGALFSQVITMQPAYACGSNTGSPKDQVLSGVDQTGTNCSGSGVNTALKNAVTILSIIIGSIAVIMILLSGFRYITSGGDSNKISSAKNTLIYALIGVAVAALAQVLVHFALAQASRAAVLAIVRH